MTEISNDTEFRQKLESLDPARQRILAARFVEKVLSLCDDERVCRVVKVAAEPHASADELATALDTAGRLFCGACRRCGCFAGRADGRRSRLAGGHEQQDGRNLQVNRYR